MNIPQKLRAHTLLLRYLTRPGRQPNPLPFHSLQQQHTTEYHVGGGKEAFTCINDLKSIITLIPLG